MLNKSVTWYKSLVLDRPVVILSIIAALGAAIATFIPDFRLDASSDSLVLENDKDLHYYRSISARYSGGDFLVVTYTPKADLYDESTRAHVKKLRDELAALPRSKSVTTYLDVPLINSPRQTLSDVRRGSLTLESPDVDLDMARQEFLKSPLYKSLIVSPDSKTTALQIILKRDETFIKLRAARDDLRVITLERPLTDEENMKLAAASKAFSLYSESINDKSHNDIVAVRAVLDKYRDKAEIHLGGVPMITSDMVDYISHDIKFFGIGVLIFIIFILTVSFRKFHWVVLPIIICAMAVVGMVGYLGLVDWRVTVVSSNFISLMLIITLSLSIHLIVRYQELHEESPEDDHKKRIWDSIRSKFTPSFYTSLTTMVAFGSLLVSGIKPVIDFGWMMVFGVGLSLILAFFIFPAGLLFFKPGTPAKRKHDMVGSFVHSMAAVIHSHSNKTLIIFIAVAALSTVGILNLTVENRFIDYFKKTTEIYQGMVMIDRQLGGTIPLDVIINPDAAFLKDLEEEKAYKESGEGSGEDEDFDDFEEEDAGLSGDSYWFNVYQLKTLKKIHQYLEEQPETGKVLSVDTSMSLLTHLNDGKELDNIVLSVMYKRLPDDLKATLFNPYMSEDGNQVRFAIRVFDSDPDLKREELLNRIRGDLSEKLGLEPQQIELTGMLVLYNNMLQSLFTSQIMTIGVVFLAIMFMFMLLFRSALISVIAIIPNLIAAGMVLGLMGWLKIPLDIMTITIAAITIGIAVDDTIHYIHRFREEYDIDKDYWAAIKRSHKGVGRAMFYTSITITLGFSILAMSTFIPTIYFGLLTGFAMMAALLANLTLLPVLLAKFKPLRQVSD